MFEEAIIQEIIEAWSADQAHPYRDRKQKPLPDPQDIRAFLETTFLASIRQEEGRSITFSITLLNKDFNEEEERRSGHRYMIMPFNVSIPFTVDSISKIAPAFDSKTTSLIVASKDKLKSEYEIWGAIFHGPSTNRFDEIPLVIGDLFLSIPDAMTVSAVSPGSLVISRGGGVIGRFLSGNFEKATPTPFVSRAMGHYIKDIIKDHKGFKQFQNRYWHVYRDTLLCLLSDASTRGHGGTIVLIPSGKVKEYESFIDTKYIFKENLNLEDFLNRMLKEESSEILFNVAMNKKYAERVAFLAQLSCIDGALILNDALHLLSFGSTLNAKKWSGKVETGHDGFGGGGEDFDASKLGTKHNSAINFVGTCPGSIAFVISQDGPVRGLIRKDEETVLCWPDCLISMFLGDIL
jgi:hypothetical protein